MNNQICHITSLHPANDPRIVFKEIQSLLKAGFKVTLIAREGKIPFQNPNFQYEKFTFRGGLLGRMTNLWKVWSIVKKESARCIHIHDPELLLLVPLIKFWKRPIIIYDVHERYIGAIQSKSYLPVWLGRLLSYLYVLFERVSFLFIDHLVLAEYNYEYYYQKKSHIVLRNLVPEKYILDKLNQAQSSSLQFIYAGAVSKARGAFELIEFANKLRGTCAFNLHIVGDFQPTNLKQQLLHTIKLLKLENRVHLYGRIPFPEVQKLLASCQYGLVFLHPQKNYKETIPTKFYEFMANGLTLIASNFEIYSQFLEKYKAGFSVDIFNLDKNWNELSANLTNTDLIKIIRTKNLATAKEQFSWEKEAERLINFYDGLING